jgi:MYXO-CTERM domain-containing protein
VIVVGVGVGVGCEAKRDRDEAGAALAPPRSQATVVIEPPQLRVGDVAEIEVAVVTPPEHAVRPLALPDDAALGPIRVLAVEALPIDKQGRRWTHRTRLRVRARDVGSGTWPALTLELVGPEGERSTLATRPRPFEVVSLLPAFPDRLEPFPLRGPEPRTAPSPWLAAAGGALATLAALGALALVRRRRRGRRGRGGGEEATEPDPGPGLRAREELVAAAARSATDWRWSADAISGALRRYTAQRWGFAIECRTTEELAGSAPPFGMARHWPAALAWLRELDALRFRPDAASEDAIRVRQIAEAAVGWIEETTPRENPR